MLSIRKVKIEGEAVLKFFSQEFRLEEMETILPVSLARGEEAILVYY